MRDNIILKCTECGDENYIYTKNKRKHPERFETMKYCPRLKKKTLHREKKIKAFLERLFFVFRRRLWKYKQS